MCSTPVLLTYCEPLVFPFSSELPNETVRTFASAEGRLTVTAGGGVPPAQMRWAAILESGLRTAPLVAIGLMVAAGLFGILLGANQLDRTTQLAAGFGFSLFSIGIALLTWKTRYDILVELLSQGRQYRSVLQFGAGQLLIRIPASPGERTFRIPREMLRDVEVEPAAAGHRGASALLDPRLLLIQTDGQIIRLMPACSDAELTAIATLIRRVYLM